jgi:hypothetical protein
MIIQRLSLLCAPNRYSDACCLEAFVSNPPGRAGWLGRARASLAQLFPNLLPKPAARTFLPRAAAADLLSRLCRELQRRAGAELPAVSFSPKMLEEGWLILVPWEDAATAEDALYTSARLIGAYAAPETPSMQIQQQWLDEFIERNRERQPSEETRKLLSLARKKQLPAQLLSPTRLAIGRGKQRRVLDCTQREAKQQLQEPQESLPTILVSGRDAERLAQLTAQHLAQQGIAVGLSGVRSSSPEITVGSSAAILENTEIEAAVLVVTAESLREHGLVADYATVLLSLDLCDPWPELLGRYGAPQCVVTEVGSALPKRFQGEKILVANNSQAPLSRHIESGGKALFCKHGGAVAVQASKRIVLPEVDFWQLASRGALWGLGMAIETRPA